MTQLYDIIKRTIKFLFVGVSSIVISCTQLTPNEKDIQQTLNKTLKLEMFNTVLKGNKKIPYKRFRQKYKYVSVVYLKDGCHYCYPIFIEWNKKIDSLKPPGDYTVLFVIKGKSYHSFINKVLKIDSIDSHYYVIMDSTSQYLRNNIEIPYNMLYKSVMIDKENKIKLIGAPYRTAQMTRLFYQICSFTNK